MCQRVVGANIQCLPSGLAIKSLVGRRNEPKTPNTPFLGFGVPYFNTFFLNGTLMKKSLYFFLPGYLKAQFQLRDRPYGNRTLESLNTSVWAAFTSPEWPCSQLGVPGRLRNVPNLLDSPCRMVGTPVRRCTGCKGSPVWQNPPKGMTPVVTAIVVDLSL